MKVLHMNELRLQQEWITSKYLPRKPTIVTDRNVRAFSSIMTWPFAVLAKITLAGDENQTWSVITWVGGSKSFIILKYIWKNKVAFRASWGSTKAGSFPFTSLKSTPFQKREPQNAYKHGEFPWALLPHTIFYSPKKWCNVEIRNLLNNKLSKR